MAFPAPIGAEEDNPLIGKWIQKLKLGSMVTEFTPTTISSTPADLDGKLLKKPEPMRVWYRRSDNYMLILFTEKGDEGIMARLEGPDSLLLILPGMGAHQLQRMSP